MSSNNPLLLVHPYPYIHKSINPFTKLFIGMPNHTTTHKMSTSAKEQQTVKKYINIEYKLGIIEYKM